MFKRPNHLFLFILFLFFSHQAWSSVGTIVLATGKVEIQRADELIEAKTGSSIFEQDKILTQANARAQLRFNDNTVITLGSNTEFGIDTFLNEGSNQAEAKFNIAKGTFKAITGQIGKAAPDKFKVKTRTATIGIRGTIFTGRITPEREMIATLSGLIFVIEDQTGLSVEVPAGQFTRIVPGQPPEPPKLLTPQELQQMNEDGEQTRGGSTEGSDNQAGANDEPEDLPNTTSSDEQNNPINDASPNVNTDLVDQALNAQIEQDIDNQLSSNSSLSVVGWKFPSYDNGGFCFQCDPFQGQGGGEPDYGDYVAYGEPFNVKASDMIGSFDNNIGWGIWEQDGLSGFWVGGTEVAAAEAHIDSLIQGQIGSTYEYAGQVLGEVIDSDGLVFDIDSANSSINLTFSFSSVSSVDGDISFSAANGSNWDLALFPGGNVYSSEFNADLAGTGQSPVDGTISGMFYGSNADSVGGEFFADSPGTSEIAQGVFKAIKQ